MIHYLEDYMYCTRKLGLYGNFLPFMLLPISSVFSKIDQSYIQAAEDLSLIHICYKRKTVDPSE